MTDTAIKVHTLSKRYRIGAEEEQHETLVGVLTAWARSPLHNDRRLKKLSTFGERGENGEADDILWALMAISFSHNRDDKHVDSI